ncbi:hypothetical protein CTI12_AA089510 [Artemisia annua]|uniref:Uncharacterized protein n=1 Tax=Artemisia annua TaxID=35608 RepID=A0A2U1Q0D1_ARTAN|nr:hypothetical protein CTI12_AA089510 [Artemisia annua]
MKTKRKAVPKKDVPIIPEEDIQIPQFHVLPGGQTKRSKVNALGDAKWLDDIGITTSLGECGFTVESPTASTSATSNSPFGVIIAAPTFLDFSQDMMLDTQVPNVGAPAEYTYFNRCDQICSHCYALFWLEERLLGLPRTAAPQYHRCCSGGRVDIPFLVISAIDMASITWKVLIIGFFTTVDTKYSQRLLLWNKELLISAMVFLRAPFQIAKRSCIHASLF